jgi:hypothetical protein
VQSDNFIPLCDWYLCVTTCQLQQVERIALFLPNFVQSKYHRGKNNRTDHTPKVLKAKRTIEDDYTSLDSWNFLAFNIDINIDANEFDRISTHVNLILVESIVKFSKSWVFITQDVLRLEKHWAAIEPGLNNMTMDSKWGLSDAHSWTPKFYIQEKRLEIL